MNVKGVIEAFHQAAPQDCYVSLRIESCREETLQLRQQQLSPPHQRMDQGYMIQVFHKGGLGYAASADFSSRGMRETIQAAQDWAQTAATNSLLQELAAPSPKPVQPKQPRSSVCTWSALPLSEKVDFLQRLDQQLRVDAHISFTEVYMMSRQVEKTFVDNQGQHSFHEQKSIQPYYAAIASKQTTERRSSGDSQFAHQRGFSDAFATYCLEDSRRIGEEALALSKASLCPTGAFDVLLMPDQMAIQIHETIGHPLELDRILGDERNYAGTSFVTADMFGSYQYGSSHLNIGFTPDAMDELASYPADDEGLAAESQLLIEQGILKRGIGGYWSQQRSHLPGTASTRASGWNRPPIDRMANIALLPGSASCADLLKNIQHGFLLKTNCSWSIDDRRDKFQFGCELAQEINHGKLGRIYRRPNYRGRTTQFWQNLSQVGREDTKELQGFYYCGKGEPNQVITVSHASPPCVFSAVDLFGGE